MGKNRHKAINLSRSEKTVLGLIANLSCPNRKFENEAHQEQVSDMIHAFKEVLHGKARRVAICILHPDVLENERVHIKARELKDWALTV
jgi:hypothetical protein